MVRRLTRSSAAWGRRVLLVTDSLVSLGVLSKGRSSSWPLLRLARQAGVCVLVARLRLYLRWVASERNHADGPSRDAPIGHHPAAGASRAADAPAFRAAVANLGQRRPARPQTERHW